jgi:hypothetical protein
VPAASLSPPWLAVKKKTLPSLSGTASLGRR